jgi:hypothetical protein
MKLDAQVERDSLVKLGTDAVDLLCRGEIDTLAGLYGYALSFGRDTATAIRDDLSRCLGQVGAISLVPAVGNPVRAVKFYKPNDSNLVAVVECVAPTETLAAVLVELVVTSKGTEKHVTLEDLTGLDVQGRITTR